MIRETAVYDYDPKKGKRLRDLKQALAQAKDGRIHILDEMAKAISSARGELSEHAPQVHSMKVPVDSDQCD